MNSLLKSQCKLQKKSGKFYFDGASNQNRFGARILIVASDDAHIPLTFKLRFGMTNNKAEYEACIIRLQAAIKLKIEVTRSNRRFISSYLLVKRRLESKRSNFFEPSDLDHGKRYYP